MAAGTEAFCNYYHGPVSNILHGLVGAPSKIPNAVARRPPQEI